MKKAEHRLLVQSELAILKSKTVDKPVPKSPEVGPSAVRTKECRVMLRKLTAFCYRSCWFHELPVAPYRNRRTAGTTLISEPISEEPILIESEPQDTSVLAEPVPPLVPEGPAPVFGPPNLPLVLQYRQFFDEVGQQFYQSLWDTDSETLITSNFDFIDSFTATKFKSWFRWEGDPPSKNRGPRTTPPIPAGETRSQRKSRIRQLTQSFFERDPTGCGAAILNDTLGAADPVPRNQLKAFWREIFARPTHGSPEEIVPIRPEIDDLAAPITLAELKAAVATLPDSSPGPDGITLSELKRVPAEELRRLFNVYLSSEYIPSFLARGSVTLIPKVALPAGPADYRPITVTSLVLRLFHKILARRLNEVELNPRQKAYQTRDGIAENLALVKYLIDDAKEHLKPMYMVFLDVSKAFDSVDRDALFAAAKRVGVPTKLTNYLRGVYSKAKVRIKGDNEFLDQTAGVRQGDPPSGDLFNMDMDWAYADLDPRLGYPVFIEFDPVTHVLFADDGIVVSQTPRGLQLNCDNLLARLDKIGLRLNPAKCSTLAIVPNRKRKNWAVDSTPFLRVNGELVPALGITDAYKYLGLKLGASGVDVRSQTDTLTCKLERISLSELRPQQKMFVLRTQLLPGALHGLVFSDCYKTTLRNLDKTVRKAVRRWLHLPGDVPNAMIHANANDGGLGVFSFETRVTRLRRDRLSRLLKTDDGLIQAIMIRLWDSNKFQRLVRMPELQGFPLTTALSERVAWQEQLYGTVDGRGLRAFRGTSSLSRWLLDPKFKIKGSEYVKAVHVRCSSLKTPARASRGVDRGVNPLCLRDRQHANLNHILQICQRTHGARVKRHDELVKQFRSSLHRQGFKTLMEPHIPLRGGSFAKPDLIAWNRRAVYVVDPIITADSASLDERYLGKQVQYDRAEVVEFALRAAGRPPPNLLAEPVGVHGLAMNYRGALGNLTLRFLKVLRVPNDAIQYMIVRELVNSWHMWHMYKSATA